MLSSDIFIDSTALLALISVKDKYHQNSREISDQLRDAGARFITTNLVVTEVVNLMIKRLKLNHLVVPFVDDILTSRHTGGIKLIFVDEELWLRGWDLLKARQDKEWDLIDCISFVVMQDRGIKAAFTADRHFEQAGFECLLKKG